MNYHRSLELKDSVNKSKIISSGVYLPDEIVKSDDIFAEFKSDTDYGIRQNWMSTTMGIHERRFSNENELPSDLAIRAAQQAIDSANNIKTDEIDMVLFCGIERDRAEPATAHTIQRQLGLNAPIAFDISNACFGFIDGLRIAEKFINSGASRYVLITTGEIPSRLTKDFVEQLKRGMSPKKAAKVIGFLSVGDAGAAVIVGPGRKKSGFNLFVNNSSSIHSNKCYYKHDSNGQIEGQMMMAQIVAKTYKMQEELLYPTMEKLGWDAPDFLLTHQVGKKAFDQVADVGLVEKDKMIKSYDKLGNITSATFGVNHHQMMNRSDAKAGDKVYCCYSGSGIVIGQFGYTI